MNQQDRTDPLASERGRYERDENEARGSGMYGETPVVDSAHQNEEENNNVAASLPDIPSGGLDFDFQSFAVRLDPDEQEKVRKRASNLLVLSESNKKLEAEVQALKERLEATERRRKELMREQAQQTMEEPLS